jgi:hypothetical protein
MIDNNELLSNAVRGRKRSDLVQIDLLSDTQESNDAVYKSLMAKKMKKR